MMESECVPVVDAGELEALRGMLLKGRVVEYPEPFQVHGQLAQTRVLPPWIDDFPPRIKEAVESLSRDHDAVGELLLLKQLKYFLQTGAAAGEPVPSVDHVLGATEELEVIEAPRVTDLTGGNEANSTVIDVDAAETLGQRRLTDDTQKRQKRMINQLKNMGSFNTAAVGGALEGDNTARDTQKPARQAYDPDAEVQLSVATSVTSI
jgi:hypothetical protein